MALRKIVTNTRASEGSSEDVSISKYKNSESSNCLQLSFDEKLTLLSNL